MESRSWQLLIDLLVESGAASHSHLANRAQLFGGSKRLKHCQSS
jgi:hypothetical protein